jgi:hypothetical protein
MLAAQLLGLLVVASVVYLVYAAVQPFTDGLGLIGITASFVLLVLVAVVLAYGLLNAPPASPPSGQADLRSIRHNHA